MDRISSILDSLHPQFHYRPHQRETILKILEEFFMNDKKYVVLDAPVGAGKSIIAKHVADVFNAIQRKVGTPEDEVESLFLTSTISLQNQYLGDFHDMRKLMGATNYKCHTTDPVPLLPNQKVHKTCKYRKDSGLCEYETARKEFKDAKLKTLNYAFYMAAGGHYHTTGLLVCDEAHNLEDQILGATECVIHFNQMFREFSAYEMNLNDYFIMHKTEDTFTIEELKNLLGGVRIIYGKITSELETLKKGMENMDTSDTQAILDMMEDQVEPLENLKNKYLDIGKTLSAVIDDGLHIWSIHYNHLDKLGSFKAIFVSEGARNFILGSAPKVLLMSATAQRVRDSLKLSVNDTAMVSVPYIFDLDNRPFYNIGGSMPPFNKGTRDTALPIYTKVIDSIIAQFPPTTNILIHSVSYDNANFILNHSENKSRILIPDRGQVRDIENVAGGGKIVVSPALLEGVNLGNGLAEVQIFIKCPYPYLGDSWVTKKKNFDDGWYDYATVLSIIQGSGRGVRSFEDKSTTFMLDPSFNGLMRRTAEYLPSWFVDSIKA